MKFNYLCYGVITTLCVYSLISESNYKEYPIGILIFLGLIIVNDIYISLKKGE